jgi:hypothetical protein
VLYTLATLAATFVMPMVNTSTDTLLLRMAVVSMIYLLTTVFDYCFIKQNKRFITSTGQIVVGLLGSALYMTYYQLVAASLPSPGVIGLSCCILFAW